MWFGLPVRNVIVIVTLKFNSAQSAVFEVLRSFAFANPVRVSGPSNSHVAELCLVTCGSLWKFILH